MKRYIHLVATKQDFPFGKKSLFFACLTVKNYWGVIHGSWWDVDEVGEL